MKFWLVLGATLALAGPGMVGAAAATNAPPANGQTDPFFNTNQPVSAPKPVVLSPGMRALLNQARQALASNDYETAAARYDAVLAEHPQSLIALTNLGVTRYQQGRLDAAETVLQKTIAIAPGDSSAWSLLGAIHFRQGKLGIALEELTRAIALDPRNAEAHNFLGIALSEKGQPAAAEQEVRRALELNPDYADAHLNLAVLYAHQQPPLRELARYHYQKALALGSPPDADLAARLQPPGNAVPPRTKTPVAP